MIFIWLIVAVAFLLLELGNPGLFFFLSFSCGAALSAIAATLDHTVTTQLGFFFAGSVIAFIALSRWVKKTSPHTPRTNVYALQGRTVIVTVEINGPESGSVKIGGEIWSARSKDKNSISAGTTVEIVTVQGVHLIVKKLNS